MPPRAITGIGRMALRRAFTIRRASRTGLLVGVRGSLSVPSGVATLDARG